MAWYAYRFPKSMTVGERRAKALRAAEKLGRKQELDPVSIEGPLASTWWGKAWNRNLEGYADYSNRLPRGRSYARHGSVIDLRIEPGAVAALVQGSRPSPYQVRIAIETVSPAARKALSEACSGRLASAEALLEGRFPEEMEKLLTAARTGLFPHPGAIRFSCSCPDSAVLCKHVAAALYGVGARLDRDPSLFFRLRKVEMEDLVSRAVRAETSRLLRSDGTGESTRLAADDGALGALFGIDLDPAGKRGPAASEPVREKEPESPAPNPGKRAFPGRVRKSGPPAPGRRREIDRAPPDGGRAGAGREAKPSGGVPKEIRSALESIKALAAALARCEAELKSRLRPGFPPTGRASHRDARR